MGFIHCHDFMARLAEIESKGEDLQMKKTLMSHRFFKKGDGLPMSTVAYLFETENKMYQVYNDSDLYSQWDSLKRAIEEYQSVCAYIVRQGFCEVAND